MRLVITADGAEYEFVPPGTVGAAYPWLTRVGPLLLSARAGHLEGVGVGETANMTFELDNVNRQAAELLGFCPRAPATIYDGDEVFFSGLIQQIDYGVILTGTIET